MMPMLRHLTNCNHHQWCSYRYPIKKESVKIENNSIFNLLVETDLNEDIKSKNNLKYLPWAAAWKEIKKACPDANFEVVPQRMDDYGNTRFWHDDGRTGWVEVVVTINGISHTEVLAIMDFKNKSIPADQITSVDANKSVKRCLTKACALHGLGLFVYMGEDVPEAVAKANALQDECAELIKKKCKISDATKEKVAALCKEAERKASPDLDDEFITGNPKNIDDVDILENLKRKLRAVR